MSEAQHILGGGRGGRCYCTGSHGAHGVEEEVEAQKKNPHRGWKFFELGQARRKKAGLLQDFFRMPDLRIFKKNLLPSRSWNNKSHLFGCQEAS